MCVCVCVCVCVCARNDFVHSSETSLYSDMGNSQQELFNRGNGVCMKEFIRSNWLTWSIDPSLFHASHLALPTRSNIPGLSLLHGPIVA